VIAASTHHAEAPILVNEVLVKQKVDGAVVALLARDQELLVQLTLVGSQGRCNVPESIDELLLCG
jgi:hypothetical protein